MAGNHVSQLSPRQRMINMMYLVLTALLALNVSKKVLDAFFKVDKDLTETILEKYDNNQDRYAVFAIKADKNPAKIGRWNDLAQELNGKTKLAIDLIDSLRYELWLIAKPTEPGTDGKKRLNIEDERFAYIKQTKSLYDLHRRLGGIPVITDKANYQQSTKIMVNGDSKKGTPPMGDKLKDALVLYKNDILEMDVFPLTDSTYQQEIKGLFKLDKVTEDGVELSWSEDKFQKIPVVAVLTFLNQLALDVVTAEDKMLSLLEQKTGSSIVSIDRQIPYGLPKFIPDFRY